MGLLVLGFPFFWVVWSIKLRWTTPYPLLPLQRLSLWHVSWYHSVPVFPYALGFFSRINTIILEMCKYRLKRNYNEHLVVCWLTWNGWKRKSVEASFGVVSDLLWYNFCIHFFQNQMCSVTAIFWFHRGLGTSEICRARYIASGTINFFGRRSWNYCLLRICSCWTRMKTYFYTDE